MQTVKSILSNPSYRRSSYDLTKLMNSKSVKLLADFLPPDEEVQLLVRGINDRKRGILAATNKRVLFVHRGPIKDDVIEFEYSDLELATVNSTKTLISIVATTDDGVFIVNGVDKVNGLEFVKHVDMIRGEMNQGKARR